MNWTFFILGILFSISYCLQCKGYAKVQVEQKIRFKRETEFILFYAEWL